jgi:hypothetical protein
MLSYFLKKYNTQLRAPPLLQHHSCPGVMLAFPSSYSLQAAGHPSIPSASSIAC